ncbi:hypothetical protein R0J87_13510 [Halomonas sp. SIMBA_159]
MNGALRDHRLTLAGGEQIDVNTVGNYFRVIDAEGGTVKVNTDAGDAFTVREGEGARVRSFQVLRVQNTDDVTRRVTMIIGSGEFESSRTVGAVTLNPAGTIQEVGEIAAGDTVPANAARQELVMRAGANNGQAVTVAGIPLQPGDVFSLGVTGPVAVGGEAGDVLHVAEVV